MQQLSTFQVYNASAGSGKTFTLVKEYLKILIQSEDVFRFQKILAITFTNKAAGEMKERVLDTLHRFSEGKKTSLLSLILEETGVDYTIIQERSTKILEAILQNYSAFSITTIDSFTHKIIKNFAYDLGLSLNFEVELDATQLLSEAVDILISKIGTDKQLTNLLIDFSLEKIDDDKSWDITRELNEFAKLLLNEDDVVHFKKLANKSLQDFVNLKDKLYSHQKNIEKRLKEIGKEGLNAIEIMQINHKDFYYSMLPNHFLALQNNPNSAKFFDQSKLRERIEENMFYSKSKSEDVKTAIETLLPELVRLYAESEQLYQQQVLYQLALKSIIPLAVLNNINAELNKLKDDNNIRLNAEFNQMIAKSIKGQPAPFIYERIGQRFTHYFIDEMQDTSVLQWQNLIPLIDNALAQENSSLLLVGDGKQAIYRWRGGKAEQFIGLSDSANPFHIEKEVKLLQTNYRSFSELINFNNHFFQHIAHFLHNESYKKLFIDGNQQLENAKKGGYVSLTFLEKNEDNEEQEIRYPKKVLEKINELKANYSLDEICILVRKRAEGVAIANYLSENNVPIISSETLLLANSAKVNFLVNVMQVMQHPSDEETRFKVLYFLYEHLHIAEEKHTFLKRFVKKHPSVVFNELKELATTFEFAAFQQLPLYEKVETIIRGFKLLTTSDAYVQFFLDVVLEQQQKGADVQAFLDFWEDKNNKLSIVAPENTDAVQIMTIHKSKGLEFPVVIFPCDVDIYRQVNPKVWFSDLSNTFDGFDELLINFNKNINYINDSGTEIYQQVREALELDNFNLLYVALTRPIEQLHIITDYKIASKGEENTNFYSGIFINYLKNIQKWNDEQFVYSFGNNNRVSTKEEKSSKTEIQQHFISNDIKNSNVLLLASASKLWDSERGKAIEYGNLIHSIMADIITSDDVAPVINQYSKQGLIPSDEKERIQNTVHSIVHHPILKQLYQKKDTIIYNERELFDIEGNIHIPDRLVFNNNVVSIIDYKTGNPEDKHQNQINVYATILSDMNFTIDKKLLIYSNDEILVEEIA